MLLLIIKFHIISVNYFLAENLRTLQMLLLHKYFPEIGKIKFIRFYLNQSTKIYNAYTNKITPERFKIILQLKWYLK